MVAVAGSALLTDKYPSTADGQSIHPEIYRPDVSKLDRWPPPVKRPPTLPRYIALAQLAEISLPAIFGARLSMIQAGAFSIQLRESGATPGGNQFMCACW